jgi:hypothetical protein
MDLNSKVLWRAALPPDPPAGAAQPTQGPIWAPRPCPEATAVESYGLTPSRYFETATLPSK